MRRAVATLALLLLLAPPVWGAFSPSDNLLTANDKGAKATWSPTTNSALEVGNVGVCVLAVDNISTGGGETSDHTLVTDDAGNTWTKQVEFSNAQGGAASCTVSIWTTVATAELSSGAAITFDILSNRTAWAATCKEFTISVGDELTQRDKVTRELDNAVPDSLDSGTVAAISHLWIHGICGETSDTGYSATSGWATFAFGSSTTSGGGSAGNMAARADYIIVSTTTENNNPNWADAPDHARGMLAFEETTAAAGRRRVIDIN
jgi:hypothetical protein